MRKIPKRPSIDDVGIRTFLRRTKKEHNDIGPSEIDEMLKSPIGYTKTQIAKAAGVSRDQLYTWMHRDPLWKTFIETEVTDESTGSAKK